MSDICEGWIGDFVHAQFFFHSVIFTSEAFQRLLHTQIWWRFLRSFVSLTPGTGLLHEDTTYSYTPVDTEIDCYI